MSLKNHQNNFGYQAQWFSVGQNYPTWLPSKFSTTLEPPLIFGKFLQSSAGTTPIYEHLKTMQEMMQPE